MKNDNSSELFKVGELVTWGNYVSNNDEFFNLYGGGPFTILEIKHHPSPEMGGHTQLVRIDHDMWFSGLWFTKKRSIACNYQQRIIKRKRLIRIME